MLPERTKRQLRPSQNVPWRLCGLSQRSSTRPAQVLPKPLLFPANHVWLICPAHQPFHAPYGTLGSVPASAHSQSFTSSRWTTARISVILDAQPHPSHTMWESTRARQGTGRPPVTPPLAPIRRERLTVHEPMSRLAPCDRGALVAPGSDSSQCLVARVAHMYLISQLPPQLITMSSQQQRPTTYIVSSL
jgi:hypothetical protein